MKNNFLCNLECPECGKVLTVNATRCRCGWKAISTAASSPTQKDYRCDYSINTHRCPLPGGLCSSPYGTGPWYCRLHWHARGDPKRCETLLLQAEKIYEDTLANRKL